ncbi:hypothetical protein [Thermococcus thioreducens]|uniref:Uncharacterized protein n=1 Tax=Thermococcus thioreducens TaxID=277988 RepID=A0A0Q2RDW1_9EURY|nr:hypothetical protein [Thermococcus thioreducens]KQH82150.1 hypothetical protein AMR53_07365 [Thermococcus thioreducens]SEW13330.1 hypothetical protein SAMN05216170_1795 [Thermococcus thioreducens]
MVPKKWLAVWLLLNFFIFWLVGLTSSGYSLEGYMPGESEKVYQYAPIVHTAPDDRPIGILYMVDYGGNLYYYIVWEDEYFSNSLIDELYRLFRGLVYGGATQDIEVVKVNPDNGTFYFQTYDHTNVHGRFLSNGSCLWEEENRVIPNCTVNGTHINVYTVTWNHMLSLLPQNGTERAVLPMRHMTPNDYVALGMFRRTQKTIAGVAVNSLLLAVVATLAFNGLMYVTWRKGYLTREEQRKVRDAIMDGWRKLKEKVRGSK